MKKKISEQDKIEASNLLEAASEIMDDCINCGLCHKGSVLFRAMKEEHISARGQARLLKDKVLDKVVFEHNLSGAEEIVCPLGIPIDEAIRKAREAMVLKRECLKTNEEMIANVRKHGNPYGKLTDEEKEAIWSC